VLPYSHLRGEDFLRFALARDTDPHGVIQAPFESELSERAALSLKARPLGGFEEHPAVSGQLEGEAIGEFEGLLNFAADDGEEFLLTRALYGIERLQLAGDRRIGGWVHGRRCVV